MNIEEEEMEEEEEEEKHGGEGQDGAGARRLASCSKIRYPRVIHRGAQGEKVKGV